MRAAAAGPSLSLRWKITLPFLMLALVLSLGMVYLLSRILGQDMQERFLRQLADSGQQATDAVVRAESDLLSVERLIANTEGVPEALKAGDAEALRARVLPLVINSTVDVVALLDGGGSSVLAVRQIPGGAAGDYETLRGEGYYSSWSLVKRLLAGEVNVGLGDKQAGLQAIQVAGQEIPVFFVGGPLKDSTGRVNGVVLSGRYLPGLVSSLAGQSGASVSVYDQFDGRLLASSLEPASPEALTLAPDTLEKAISPPATGDPLRTLSVSGTEYREVLTAFVARQGTEPLGVLGVSLPDLPIEERTSSDLWTIVAFGAVALALVVVSGILLANSITRPIIAIADASAQVARGNLDTRVADRGNDELAVLARSFNQMVADLRERTLVEPRPEEPPTLAATRRPEALPPAPSTASLRAKATVLCLEAQGFEAMEEDPEGLVRGLNEFVGLITPILGRHAGVISAVDGAVLTAHFGVLPRPSPAAVSSMQGMHAGMEILEAIRDLNAHRLERGLGPLRIAIGMATGDVVAGHVTAADRQYAALVGEAVTVAQGIVQIAREAGPAAMLISEETYRSLGAAQRQFVFGRFGRAQVRGLSGDVGIHEVRERLARLVDQPGSLS